MDSLLASYASSDEEEENQRQTSVSLPRTTSTSSPFSSLPQPISSSFFPALPQPKHQSSTLMMHRNNVGDSNKTREDDDPKPSSKSSSLFSFLPQPKTQVLQPPTSNVSALEPGPKRVVQFKPPINPIYAKPSDLDDEDDEDEGENEKKLRKDPQSTSQSSSVMSFLSSIPAPRNSSTLGFLPSSAGSGRRSIVETKTPAFSSGNFGTENDQNTGTYRSHDGASSMYDSGSNINGGNYVNYGTYGNYESSNNQEIGENTNNGDGGSSHGSYENYSSCGTYSDYQHYGNNWGDELTAPVPEVTGSSESFLRGSGKRGRKDIPTEVIEVKQDELTKNRPREDQVKMTGIAFGPAYQPASTKGKPSKLHKRKHQIGSLFFDMKQKETELAERRSKGFVTKAQTQAKYGW